MISSPRIVPRITVIGLGGGGIDALETMIERNLRGVDFVAADGDARRLMHSRAGCRVQLGPHIGEEAAEALVRHLDGTQMVFIVAGMGGGTGTDAAPFIARMARERDILTIGVVTRPFAFEGRRRMDAAEEGIAALRDLVDTLIVIPARLAAEHHSISQGEAFWMADQALYQAVRGITDLMVAPGLVDLDYRDLHAILAQMGQGMAGTGEGMGEDRALMAASAAMASLALDDEPGMKGAQGLLVNITGGSDLTLHELDQAACRIHDEVNEDANLIVGMGFDETLAGQVRISVVVAGITPQAAYA